MTDNNQTGSERTITFQVLVLPDGSYELVAGGGGPVGWINGCLSYGAVIHTIEVTVPVPPEKPRLMGKLKDHMRRPPGTVGSIVWITAP